METSEFIEDMLAELADDHDLAPPPTPASASAAAAAARRDEAERKRRERASRKEAGMPDGRVVDAAIAAAFVELLSMGDARKQILERGSAKGLTVNGSKLIFFARRNLTDRGVSPHAAAQALQQRLFPEPRQRPASA